MPSCSDRTSARKAGRVKGTSKLRTTTRGKGSAKTMDGSINVRSASILVVDDIDADARLIEAMLAGSGYTAVASTSDPRQVAELHRRNRYDLIVLDLMMPGMDGFQVLEELKKVEPTGFLPVLVVTAEPEHMARALGAGARDFISKPVRMAELLARVHNLLEVRLLLSQVRGNGRKLQQMLQQSTDELRKSEELFRLFATHIPEALWIRGVEDRLFRYINPAWEVLTGLRLVPGDRVERTLEAVHPLDRERVSALFERSSAGGVDEEIRYLGPDGELRWGHVRTFAIADPQGKPAWVAGILHNITARKRLQEQARLHGERLEAEVSERRRTEVALRETEGRFRALVEQSIVGIYVVEEGRFTYANPRLCEMLGYSQEELRGIMTIDLVVEEDRARLADNRRRRDAGDAGALVATYRLRRKDGRILHLAVDGRMLEVGGRRALFGIGQDITERVRAQELLQEAEGHYRALVEQSLVGISIVMGLRIMYANPRLCEMLGYTLDELARLDIARLLAQEDHRLIEETVQRRRAGETGSIAVTCRGRRKDGGIVHLSIETKIIDLGGRKAAIGIVQDVTERARAAQALRESEEKFRLLWETATDAVILMDEDMRIQYANPSVLQVFGYAPEELEGKDITLLQPERLREPHRRAMKRYLATGIKTLNWRASEIAALHRDGHEFPVEIGFSRLSIGGRSIFAGFLRDISERKRAQDALEEAIKRLRFLSKRVLDIQEAERRSISRELHDDVGQSLIALRIGLHRLGQHVPGEQARLFSECLEVIGAVQERLREMSIQLHPPQLEQLGLQDALRALASRQKGMTGLEIGCAFRGIERERFPIAIEGACYRICQEALNNATQHSQAARIEITMRFEDGVLELMVRDQGVGFDEQDGRERMLVSGSMGLASMEERARLAGGRLEIVTRPGGGTCVVARFPVPAAVSGDRQELVTP